MSGIAERKERINFRLDRRNKDIIERAAAVSFQSLTEFAISHLVQDAQVILQQHETAVLSDRDRDIFLRMLDEEVQPNDALKRAARIYRRQRA